MSFTLACVAVATVAVAPPDLKTAEALMAKYKYAEAQAALKKARAAKGLDRASLLRILELQGIAAGQQRQAGPATAAFTELLVLDPTHKLGEDFAPRVSTPFLEASSSVAETGALELKQLPPGTRDGRVVALNVEVPKDPLKLTRSLVFHFMLGGAWQTKTATLDAGKASVSTDAGEPEVKFWVELFGDNEAQLVVLGSESAPVLATPPAPMVSATPPPPPTPVVEPIVTKAASSGGGVRTASYFVLGGAVVAGGVGAFFGIRNSTTLGSITGATRDADGRITGLTEREAQTRGAQAATDGAIANVMFVSAGALAAAGVVMFIVGGPETPAKVSLAPAPGGVLVSGSFP